MATRITFENPYDPPNDGAVRVYADDAMICCTDRGNRPLDEVEAGWKIRRKGDSMWLTVKTVEPVV